MYNRSFDLGIHDLDMIETALRARKSELSKRRLRLLTAADPGADIAAELDQINTDLSQTQDLLGRLHNQKVFYRPKHVSAAPYVGG